MYKGLLLEIGGKLRLNEDYIWNSCDTAGILDYSKTNKPVAGKNLDQEKFWVGIQTTVSPSHPIISV